MSKLDAEIEEATRMALEHRDMLLNLRVILQMPAGQKFFKYLFKSFDVAQLPEKGLEGMFLHDRLGFMRAGNSVFKIACEANPEIAARLLAETEKEEYERLQQISKAEA